MKKKVKIGLGVISGLLVITIVASFVFLKGDATFLKPETIATLCIDPGHGGYDAGTIGADGSYEKDINLDIALAVGDEIEKLDPRIKIIYTRNSDNVSWPEDETQDLEARVQFAQDNDADYYLSIHMNSNDDPSVYGYESYVRENDTFSQAVVEKIANNLDDAGWLYNRGTLYVEEYPLYVVSQQTIPSLLFEAGFMSNYTECTELQKNSNQKLIAHAIAQAYVNQIVQDLNVEAYQSQKES